jgi:hypothetical protein
VSSDFIHIASCHVVYAVASESLACRRFAVTVQGGLPHSNSHPGSSAWSKPDKGDL